MTARKRPSLTGIGGGARRPQSGDAGVAAALEQHEKATQKEEKPPRSKATFDLPPDLLGELRVASVLAGETLATIAERALAAELERLRAELNQGEPFPVPASGGGARKGRPPKK